MSSHVTNNPFLDMLANENSKKTGGSKNPFANNPSITDNEFFNPLENQNYREILQQMNRSMQPTLEKTPKMPTLSDVLNTAQSEIRKISDHVGSLKRLASTAADTKQTDSARDFLQRDFYETVGKINSTADKMNWNGMTISEGNSQYKINQTKSQSVEETNNYFTKPTDITDKIGGANSTTEIVFQGNLNANEAIITSIDGNSEYNTTVNSNGKIVHLTLSDGTTMTVPPGTYTVGHSVPMSNNLTVYDSQGMKHDIPIQLEKASANTWIAKLSSATTAATIPRVDGSMSTSDTSEPYYSYVKEADGTYTRVSFIDNDGSLVTAFKINFDTTGQPIGNLAYSMRLEYNFDSYPPYSTDEPRMFIQRPGGLFTYTDGRNTYITSNTFVPAGYYNSIKNLKSYVPINYTFNPPVNGADVTESTANFIGLTQYVGENTVRSYSDGSIAKGRTIPDNAPTNDESTQINNSFNNPGFMPTTMPIHVPPSAPTNIPSGPNMPIGPSMSPHMPPPRQQSMTVININLWDMHPSSLGTGNLLSPQGRFLNPFDQQRYNSFFGNTSMQNNWMDIVRGASNKNLNSINIMSQRNASIALRVLEGALSQVQRELSNINAYIQRFIASNETLIQPANNGRANYSPYNNGMLRDNLV